MPQETGEPSARLAALGCNRAGLSVSASAGRGFLGIVLENLHGKTRGDAGDVAAPRQRAAFIYFLDGGALPRRRYAIFALVAGAFGVTVSAAMKTLSAKAKALCAFASLL